MNKNLLTLAVALCVFASFSSALCSEQISHPKFSSEMLQNMSLTPSLLQGSSDGDSKRAGDNAQNVALVHTNQSNSEDAKRDVDVKTSAEQARKEKTDFIRRIIAENDFSPWITKQTNFDAQIRNAQMQGASQEKLSEIRCRGYGLGPKIDSKLGYGQEDTCIQYATKNGDIVLLQELLEKQVPEGVKGTFWSGCLSDALKQQNLEMLKVLLTRVQQPDAQRFSKIFSIPYQVIIDAAAMTDSRFLQMIRNHLEFINDKSPLSLAYYKVAGYLFIGYVPDEQRISIAAKLLDAGADVNYQDVNNAGQKLRTPLAHIAERAHDCPTPPHKFISFIDLLLERNAQIMMADLHRKTALNYISMKPSNKNVATHFLMRCAYILSDKSMTPEFIKPEHITPFYNNYFLLSCMNNDIEKVKFYLAQVSPTIANDFQSTPLHYAAAHKNTPLVDMLLCTKADINSRNGHDETSLFIAVENGNSEIVQLLLTQNANPNICSNYRDAKHLRERGRGSPPKYAPDANGNYVTVNWPGCPGTTPLMRASVMGNLSIVHHLLEANADVSQKNHDNKNALELLDERIGIPPVWTERDQEIRNLLGSSLTSEDHKKMIAEWHQKMEARATHQAARIPNMVDGVASEYMENKKIQEVMIPNFARALVAEFLVGNDPDQVSRPTLSITEESGM